MFGSLDHAAASVDDAALEEMLLAAKRRSATMLRRHRRRKTSGLALAAVLVATAGGVILGTTGGHPGGRAAQTGRLRWSLVADVSAAWRVAPVDYVGESLDCLQVDTCFAEGLAHRKPTLELTVNGGRTWRTVNVPAYIDPPLDCLSATTCAAVGLHGPGHFVFIETSNGGTTWSSSPFPGSPPLALSCSSASSCVAIARRGNVLRDGIGAPEVAYDTSDAGSSWSEYPLPLTAESTLGSFSPDGLSCAGGSCTALGVVTSPTGQDTGVALYSEDGGMSWSSGSVPAGFSPGYNFSCSGASACVATGTGGAGPAVVVTDDGGRSWRWAASPLAGKGFLNWLSCSSSRDCVVTGGTFGTNGQPLIADTTDGASTWTLDAIPPVVTAVGNLSCPMAGVCYALGAERVQGREDALVFLAEGR